MSETHALLPLEQVLCDERELLQIQRNELLPVLDDPHQLNHYADHVVQAQAQQLQTVNPELTHALSQVIEQLIVQLSRSKKFLKRKSFNRLQRWFGRDLEYAAQQVAYYQKLDGYLTEADRLSTALQKEITASQARYQAVMIHRHQMAKYIKAAEQFKLEYPKFKATQHFDLIESRLSKKIETLHTLQSSNDIVITQIQLSQHLAFSLLDRFKEAQQVLIPAWKYHIQQLQQHGASQQVEQLDRSREKLIESLKRAL